MRRQISFIVLPLALLTVGGQAHSQAGGTRGIAPAYVQPQPIGRDTWTIGSSPPESWLTPTTTPVGSALTVRPGGSVQSCAISPSSGNAQLDRFTCDLLMRNAQFKPARAADGTPIYGVFRIWTVWTNWMTAERQAYDFKLVDDQLSAGADSPKRIDIVFIVDASGKVLSCGDENGDDEPRLVAAACERVGSSMALQPARTDAGVTVPSVQDATVAIFSSTHAADLSAAPRRLVCDTPAGHYARQNVAADPATSSIRARLSLLEPHVGTKWETSAGILFAFHGEHRYAGIRGSLDPSDPTHITIGIQAPGEGPITPVAAIPLHDPLDLTAQFRNGVLTVAANGKSWFVQFPGETVEGAFLACNSGKFEFSI